MTEFGFYTVYRDYRIYLLEESDFELDDEGRYVVHVEIAKLSARLPTPTKIPDCFASNLKEAQELSMRHALRLVDDLAQKVADTRESRRHAAPSQT